MWPRATMASKREPLLDECAEHVVEHVVGRQRVLVELARA